MEKNSYVREARFLDLYYGSYPNEDCDIKFRKDELYLLLDDKAAKQMEEIEKTDKAKIQTSYVFPTAKQAYLALKMQKFEDFLEIFETQNAFDANKLAKGKKTRKDLKYLQEDLMRYILRKKFEQHPYLLKQLIAYNGSLAYKSVYADYTFGLKIDDNGKILGGKNLLGKIYSEIKREYTPKELYTYSNKYDETTDEFLKKLKGKCFYIIDTEATGLKATDSIIELSAIKVSDTFELLDEFDVFINPGFPLPKEIIKFNEINGTGITQELIDTEGISEEEAILKFDNFIGDNPLISGHNLDSFDVRMLNGLYARQGKQFKYEMSLDTLKIAKDNLAGSHKLGDIFKQIDNPEINVVLHRSIDDVKATLEVLKYLLEVRKKQTVKGVPILLNNYARSKSTNVQYDKEKGAFVSNSIIVVEKQNGKKALSVDIPHLCNDIKEIVKGNQDKQIFLPFVQNSYTKMIFNLPYQTTREILKYLAKEEVYAGNLYLYNFDKVGGTLPHVNENFTYNLKDYLEKNFYLEPKENNEVTI